MSSLPSPPAPHSKSPAPPHALRTGWNPWPISIIAFFTLAILGCASFIAFCSHHPADLVAPDYYEQEIRYQHQMDRVQHARERSQLTSVSYDPATRRITVSMPSRDPQRSVSGTIQLYRPSASNLDRQIKLTLDANSVQTIDATTLLPGLWKVRVSWTSDNQDYFLDQKVIITAKGT